LGLKSSAFEGLNLSILAPIKIVAISPALPPAR